MNGLFEEMPSEEGLVLAKVIESPDTYRPSFYDWLRENFRIWKRFVLEADRIRGTGREHYSARTIGEFLRHQTHLREKDGIFKVNDHVWPDCARLYMALRPEAQGFFELRGNKTRGI